MATLLALCGGALPALGQTSSANTEAIPPFFDWLDPDRISGTVAAVLLLSALSLVPALILMTTCFVRIVIVLSLLRQALGSLGQPSNQILGALALFMTGTIMAPAARTIYGTAIVPYRAGQLTRDDALLRAAQPVRQFMARQIERTGNADDIWLFLEHTGQADRVQTYDDVPFTALAPAFLLSELKTAFLIGFQVYLPFLVIDLVVSIVITGIGLTALPPTLVSFPAKLLLFVMVDGWHLVVGMLLDSFA
jgi:flagellar biosynthetic protein FliP